MYGKYILSKLVEHTRTLELLPELIHVVNAQVWMFEFLYKSEIFQEVVLMEDWYTIIKVPPLSKYFTVHK